MFEHKRLQSLDDYFLELCNRKEKGVFFYRINGYDKDIHDFIRKYYEQARRTGVVIEGKIPNPDEKNLEYYEENMGKAFEMNMPFINASLKKWLPRMNDYQRESVAGSILQNLLDMQRQGKNEAMIKNAYIKYMCWLYYKFERVVNQLGANAVPKILYEGSISNYELKLISILSNAGCDVVMLQYNGDTDYLKLDPTSALSESYTPAGKSLNEFPKDFNIRAIVNEIQEAFNNERLYGAKPQTVNCTNAWINTKVLENIQTPVQQRGTDPNCFYNCFFLLEGVEDKLTYLNDLYQLQLSLKNNKRKVVIQDGDIQKPTPDEINTINRKNYQKYDQMILDLCANLSFISNAELKRLANKAFVDLMLEQSKLDGMNINKLVGKAVNILCWLKRYYSELFGSWKSTEISVFMMMGAVQTDNEALFIRLLSRMPVDVVVFAPNLNVKSVLEDKFLFNKKYDTSLEVSRYPRESTDLHMGTVAYHAERELDSIMYQDTGMYRNQQFGKANIISLQTMYEEIELLWKQELKYRPNFDTSNNVVTIPVIFAKISGVNMTASKSYTNGIRDLITADTIVINDKDYIKNMAPNPMKQHATDFFKNGKVQKSAIKNCRDYQYGFLREEMQDYILDKLQLLIDSRNIKGTFENGTEYTIVSTILNMNMDVVRLIQKFDFTKTNPKLIYINTTERMITLEDSILIAFLNLVGFDILFFIPTGYQNVEKYFNRMIMEEHQIGEYKYDVKIADSMLVPQGTKRSFVDVLFGRNKY